MTVGFFVEVYCYAAVAFAAEHACLVFVFEKSGFVGFAVLSLFLLGAMAEEEGEEGEEYGESEGGEDDGDGNVGFGPVAWVRLDCGCGLGDEVVVFCWCGCHD